MRTGCAGYVLRRSDPRDSGQRESAGGQLLELPVGASVHCPLEPCHFVAASQGYDIVRSPIMRASFSALAIMHVANGSAENPSEQPRRRA
jgi:hypothetical protein